MKMSKIAAGCIPGRLHFWPRVVCAVCSSHGWGAHCTHSNGYQVCFRPILENFPKEAFGAISLYLNATSSLLESSLLRRGLRVVGRSIGSSRVGALTTGAALWSGRLDPPTLQLDPCRGGQARLGTRPTHTQTSLKYEILGGCRFVGQLYIC